MKSCEAEWLEFGSASVSGGGAQVFVVDQSVLDEFGLLFERDAG